MSTPTSAPWEHLWTRLPLTGAVNAREIGGYPTEDGRQTAWHQFVRSDRLSLLTASDEEFLWEWGVRSVIDLRGADEARSDPDRYVGRAGVDYVNYPLLSGNAADPVWSQKMAAAGKFSMYDIYDLIVENTEGICQVFTYIAHAQPGVVLFHCAEGKDRTGIVAMLLMSLAGCRRTDCVANYVPSRANLMARTEFAEIYRASSADALQFFDTPPQMIEHAMDHVGRTWGSTEDYLRAAGVSATDIAHVKARVLGEL